MSGDTDYTKDDAEFQDIATQRYMYNANKCAATPLVGYMLNKLPMPPLPSGKDQTTGQPIMRDWDAFLVRTTRPVLAVNRDKEVVTVPPGSEVLIPATYELAQFMSKAASAPDVVFEVKITPDKKIPLDAGMHLWLYKLAAKKTPMPRRSFGVSAILGAPQLVQQRSAPAMGSGEAVPALGAGDDDIPF